MNCGDAACQIHPAVYSAGCFDKQHHCSPFCLMQGIQHPCLFLVMSFVLGYVVCSWSSRLISSWRQAAGKSVQLGSRLAAVEVSWGSESRQHSGRQGYRTLSIQQGGAFRELWQPPMHSNILCMQQISVRGVYKQAQLL